jgi:hypothetical protein
VLVATAVTGRSRQQDVDHERADRRRRGDLGTGRGGAVGFPVPTDLPGFAAPEIKHTVSLRASPIGEITLDGVRLPKDAGLATHDRSADARRLRTDRPVRMGGVEPSGIRVVISC